MDGKGLEVEEYSPSIMLLAHYMHTWLICTFCHQNKKKCIEGNAK